MDSDTTFGCQLEKHGGDTLEVNAFDYISVSTISIFRSYFFSLSSKLLTVVCLECNHNIHIVGFASDDTRISLSKLTISSSLCMIITQGLSMTLRSQRFAQVQQAK